MLSSAARFHVLIWRECTPYFLNTSANVSSLEIASRSTRALNSGERVFLFVMSDHHFN
jgi:hypothetical protein